MNYIRDLFCKSEVFKDFCAGKKQIQISNEMEIALFSDAVYTKKPRDILIVCPSMNEAQIVYSNIVELNGYENTLFFPGDEVVRLKKLTTTKELIGERIHTLATLSQDRKPKIVVANLQGALRFVPEKKTICNNIFVIQKGQKVIASDVKKRLTGSGYRKVQKITASLQFASRGDVIDVFPINSSNPIRIDFFDDEIEDVREFKISTQKSFKSLDKATIYPGSEHLFSSESLSAAYGIIDMKFDSAENLNQEIRDFLWNQLDQCSDGGVPFSSERFLSVFGLETSSLIDLLNNPIIVKFDTNKIVRNFNEYAEKQNSYNKELCKANESIPEATLLHPLELFSDEELIDTDRLHNPQTEFGLSYLNPDPHRRENPIATIQKYIDNKYHIYISASTDDEAEGIARYLDSKNLSHNYKKPGKTPIKIIVSRIARGFEISDKHVVLMLESDLFGTRKPRINFVSHYKEGSSIDSYLDLEINDYIVHELYGIGKYLGLIRLESLGAVKDTLKIEYAKGEIIFVPVLQIDYIRKYLGREGFTPSLTRVNSQEWARMKKKVKDDILENYQKLLELYKIRLAEPGNSLVPVPDLENQVNDSFEHELTPDQIISTKEILGDMEEPYPMDRLLCGDVGFGKTEVAIRAASRAISNGYQVGIVCPTTILASQHYEVFKKRFEQVGFKVALLSRFVEKKEQKKLIEQLRLGKIDVLVATHRAMSKDVVFNNIGLLVIDEEQRFGVKQKETIKMKYPNIDVLTLSATPIPRTLQMSLLNLRAISRINTAPVTRSPINTYVVKEQNQLINEIIEQELGRNGQVFYLSNRVEGIQQKVEELRIATPQARIGVIHGQMKSEDIENTLYLFANHEIDVLVCTTIIENGIDYPNANTLIIENAQNFGLSQLYQIKGRIGRGDRIAFAYLIYNDKTITDEGAERLKAIQKYTDLGSGYKIAEQDLLIRGAGEIIGENQSGFISNVGLDMYSRLFEEVVYEETFKRTKDVVKHADISLFHAAISEIDTGDDEKMEIYQRLSRVDSLESLDLFILNLQDEFGRLPQGIENLVEKKRLDLYTNARPIKSIIEDGDAISIMIDRGDFVYLRDFLLTIQTDKVRLSRFNIGEIRVAKSNDFLKNLVQTTKKIVEYTKKIMEGQKNGS